MTAVSGVVVVSFDCSSVLGCSLGLLQSCLGLYLALIVALPWIVVLGCCSPAVGGPILDYSASLLGYWEACSCGLLANLFEKSFQC